MEILWELLSAIKTPAEHALWAWVHMHPDAQVLFWLGWSIVVFETLWNAAPLLRRLRSAAKIAGMWVFDKAKKAMVRLRVVMTSLARAAHSLLTRLFV